jgi:hypothetical protein
LVETNKREPVFPRLRQIGARRPPKQVVPRGRTSWQERFLGKIDKYGPAHAVLGSRCHLWLGGKQSSGYGQFKHAGKMQLAHRVAFLLAYGRWPAMHALHHCEVRLCVNPEHLFEGHVRRDVSNKSRVLVAAPPKAVVLSETQIESLRKRFNGRNIKQLAKLFGITNSYATELVYTTTRLPGHETSVGVRA